MCKFPFPSVAAAIIIICWCSLSLTPYPFPKATPLQHPAYTLYGISSLASSVMMEKKLVFRKKCGEEEKGEGFYDMKRMKRKRATQQGKSSNIIGAVGMAWGKDTRKKFQHCIINLRFFIFLRNRRSSSSWTENEKRLHREIESATGNRNSWKQKKKLSLLSV